MHHSQVMRKNFTRTKRLLITRDEGMEKFNHLILEISEEMNDNKLERLGVWIILRSFNSATKKMDTDRNHRAVHKWPRD